MIDPYKAEQFVRAPKLFDDINIIFMLIYYSGLTAFVVFAFLSYYYQTPVETSTMSLASTVAPITLNITTHCSGKFQCGDWVLNSGKWTLLQPIMLTQTWAHVPTSSPCYSNSGSAISIPASGTELVTVCYSDSIYDGIVLQIPFGASYNDNNPPSLTVTITSGPQYSNGMTTMAIMQPSQYKTFFFSQTVHVSTSGVQTFEPYVADMFYNGIRSSSLSPVL